MSGLLQEEENFLTNPDNIASDEGIERLKRLRLSLIKAIIAKSDALKEAVKKLIESGKCDMSLKYKLISALKP